MDKLGIDQFLNDFVSWACVQDDIHCVALVGSYARGTHTPSSDVDLVIITQDTQKRLNNNAWIQHFGTINNQQYEPYGRVTSLRVWYTSGLEVEYGITDESWAALPLDEGTSRVISNGIRILYDRQSLLNRVIKEIHR